MSHTFSEETFLINLLTEITSVESFRQEQPLLHKLATNYRNHLVKSTLRQKLAEVNRRATELKMSLLQSIKADQWNESARITAEISQLSKEKTAVLAKIEELGA
jgi:hypothetical protein